jgi:hypothetical protein
MNEQMTWAELNSTIMEMNEEQVLKLLQEEATAENIRFAWMFRLHSRYNVLRVNRERIELSNGQFKIQGAVDGKN